MFSPARCCTQAQIQQNYCGGLQAHTHTHICLFDVNLPFFFGKRCGGKSFQLFYCSFIATKMRGACKQLTVLLQIDCSHCKLNVVNKQHKSTQPNGLQFMAVGLCGISAKWQQICKQFVEGELKFSRVQKWKVMTHFFRLP